VLDIRRQERWLKLQRHNRLRDYQKEIRPTFELQSEISPYKELHPGSVLVPSKSDKVINPVMKDESLMYLDSLLLHPSLLHEKEPV
jgi:hypothetical protein